MLESTFLKGTILFDTLNPFNINIPWLRFSIFKNFRISRFRRKKENLIKKWREKMFEKINLLIQRIRITLSYIIMSISWATSYIAGDGKGKTKVRDRCVPIARAVISSHSTIDCQSVGWLVKDCVEDRLLDSVLEKVAGVLQCAHLLKKLWKLRARNYTAHL